MQAERRSDQPPGRAAVNTGVSEWIIWLPFSFFLAEMTPPGTFPDKRGGARRRRTEALKGRVALFRKLS